MEGSWALESYDSHSLCLLISLILGGMLDIFKTQLPLLWNGNKQSYSTDIVKKTEWDGVRP